jgi:NAD(P)-dependent dehydrogenase (short-subunit alcohol dehydrogenase family)
MIIITGASRGIGKFLFEHFGGLDAERVIGTYNNTEPQNKTNSSYKLDVSDYKSVEKVVQNLELKSEQLTLINCAGINYSSFAHKSDPVRWKRVLETNLFGTYNMIRTLLPPMRENNFGRIINFSSVVAIRPTPGISSYAASKSSLWGLSKSISIENAKFNITINNINMGYSELGMIKEVPAEYLNSIIEQIPMGRLCTAIDILNTVDYLRKTSYINGSSIDLSGGLI